MHLLRLSGRRRLAGADRPDRLIGHHDFADAMAVGMDHRGQLAFDHLFGLPGFTLRQCFAHAHDGRDALASAALALSATSLVGFAVVLAALRVPTMA
jgi:hypothetical protein